MLRFEVLEKGSGLHMGFSLAVFATRLISIMFFSGLVGCCLVVVISWVSIFKEGFSDPKNAKAEHN